MRNNLLALVVVTLLGSSSMAIAADLETEMDTLKDNYAVVLKTDSLDIFKKSLQTMRTAAQDAQKATPPKLKDKPADSPEMKDFRQGLDTLIGQIDQSLALAEQGKLEDARKVAQEFKQTRDVNHKKFR